MNGSQDIGIASASQAKDQASWSSGSKKAASKGHASFGSMLSQASSSGSSILDSIYTSILMDVRDSSAAAAKAEKESSRPVKQDSRPESSSSNPFGNEWLSEKARIEGDKPKPKEDSRQESSSEDKDSSKDEDGKDSERKPAAQTPLMLLQGPVQLPVQAEAPKKLEELAPHEEDVSSSELAPALAGDAALSASLPVQAALPQDARLGVAEGLSSQASAAVGKPQAAAQVDETVAQPQASQESPAPELQAAAAAASSDEPRAKRRGAQGEGASQQAQDPSAQPVASQASVKQPESYSSSASSDGQQDSSAKQDYQAPGSSRLQGDARFQDGAQVKIQSVSYESSASSQPAAQTAQGSSASQADLMQSLMNRQSSFAMAASRMHAASAQSRFQADHLAPEASAAKTPSIEAAGMGDIAAKSSLAQARSSEGGFNGSSHEGKDFSGGHFDASTLKNAAAQPKGQPQKASAFRSSNDAVNAVQEICSKMQQALKGSSLDFQKSFSMDLEVDGLGRVKLALDQKGETLSVVFQTASESSREQLMNQRDEISREMKELGYKDFSIDVRTGSDGRDSNADWRRRGAGFSNAESEENVKLAGNAKADLAEILGMRS